MNKKYCSVQRKRKKEIPITSAKIASLLGTDFLTISFSITIEIVNTD